MVEVLARLIRTQADAFAVFQVINRKLHKQEYSGDDLAGRLRMLAGYVSDWDPQYPLLRKPKGVGKLCHELLANYSPDDPDYPYVMVHIETLAEALKRRPRGY